MRFATTLPYADDAAMAARAIFIPRRVPAPRPFVEGAVLLVRTFRAGRSDPVLLLDSSCRPAMLAGAMLGALPGRRAKVVVVGEMWNPDSGLPMSAAERVVVRLGDRAVAAYAVYSAAEGEAFARAWNIDPKKLRVVPYFFSFTPADVAAPTPELRPYVFAGGNALRDYEPLLTVARSLPDARFVFATSAIASDAGAPPNVVVEPVLHAEFVRRMQAAAAVVVPLRLGVRRGAGHQTYLNAMSLAKPTIVSDALGVREYVEHDVTGLVVDGSPSGYRAAIAWALDPENADAVRRMGERARETVVRDFSFERHVERLIALVDEIARA